MIVRAYEEADAPVLMRLFHDTVHAVCVADYTPAELDAWSPAAGLDPARWRARFARTRPWVAVAASDGPPVGFLELDDAGHIDCCYAHRDWQRRGVGTALLAHALGVARAARIPRLDAEVSVTALPFFTRHGFAVVRAQQVERHGRTLRNYVMERLMQSTELTLQSTELALRTED